MGKPEGIVTAVFGARGTGKTGWVVQQLMGSVMPYLDRQLLWDFKNDPRLRPVGQPVANIASLARAAKAPHFVLRYQVDHTRDIAAQFDLFCQIAWAAGDLTMFVDELPEVTRANKAPAAWRRCVNVGRQYTGHDGRERSINILAAAQRPAECDKSFIGNANLIHTGRMTNTDDARELSKAIGCDFTLLVRLPNLHWVERRDGMQEYSQGVLSFGNRKPAAKTSPKKPALRAQI